MKNINAEVREASENAYGVENYFLGNRKSLPQLPNKTLINARHTPNGMIIVAD